RFDSLWCQFEWANLASSKKKDSQRVTRCYGETACGARGREAFRGLQMKINLVGLRKVVGCKRKNQTGKLVGLEMVVGREWKLVSRSKFK
ncbi:hypothetical protein L195_g010594, partial [Trifolium pratense]